MPKSIITFNILTIDLTVFLTIDRMETISRDIAISFFK